MRSPIGAAVNAYLTESERVNVPALTKAIEAYHVAMLEQRWKLTPVEANYAMCCVSTVDQIAGPRPPYAIWREMWDAAPEPPIE